MEGGCIVDPSGGGAAVGALGGFTSVAATLWRTGLSFRVPFYITVNWGRVSVSARLSLGMDGDDDGGFDNSVNFSDGATVTVGRAGDARVDGVVAVGLAGPGADAGG